MKPSPSTAAPRPPVIFLMGPTCSGKTAAAVELVQRLPLEIVSVDSAMVYRGMDIGTAKPTPEVLARAPHHLIDIREPSANYSAGEFRADALAAIEAIRRAGRVPLLVGGTGLYFRALERGLSPLPPADAATRAALGAEAARLGWAAMHARLAAVDPQAAARIHPNDPQRIQRALEVHALTGRSMSDWWAAHRTELPYALWKFVLCPTDREDLRRRVEARFHQMLSEGFLDEVRRLRDRGDLHADLPALRVVGYRQAWAHLHGRCDRASMIRAAVAATRQLAKRQLTWLRAEPGARWLDAGRPEQADELVRSVEHILHRHVKIKRV
ncbi:MAG: tRNA dimethylallyltransferase [Gammaproteobacteria bacterium]|nr:tRNA dimethylallyltransferase [Gammaproteobacteria bacterium]